MGTSSVTPTLRTSTCDTGTAGAGLATPPDSVETRTLAPFQNPPTSSPPGPGPWLGRGAVPGHGNRLWGKRVNRAPGY